MVFSHFVEIGRIVFINHGALRGRICVILDVIDKNRVLVHGPTTGVPRLPMNLTCIKLTKFKINITRGARTEQLKSVLEKNEILKKYNESGMAKKIKIQKARRMATDFERFKLMRAKQLRSRLIKKKEEAMVSAATTTKAEGKKKEA